MVASRIASGLLALLVMALAANFLGWFEAGLLAVPLERQLDYGEGIVWQQALMILRGDGYADITGPPFLVFHYPPVFHVLSGALAGALGLSELIAGRILSAVSTVAAAMAAGAVVCRAQRSRESRLTSALCGLLTALLLFTMYPVTMWSVLMRVDMAAMVFVYLGIWFALRAPESRTSLVLGALSFVIALYTKQTALAAPLAMLAAVAIVSPRRAGAALAVAAAAGGAVLIVLQIATSGEFLRHIVTYNNNKMEFYRISVFGYFLLTNPICIFLVFFLRIWRPEFFDRNMFRVPGLAARMRTDPVSMLSVFALLHFMISSAMILTVTKVGSGYNYFIEWIFSGAVLLGISLGPVLRMALSRRCDDPVPGRPGSSGRGASRGFLYCVLLGALLAHAVLSRAPRSIEFDEPSREQENREIIRLVREASKPVVSDDMVALLLAGKEIYWETDIFTDLAARGLWDSAPIVRMIRSKQFAFFVTERDETDVVFQSRYSGEVLEAMKQNYPRQRKLGNFTLRLPAE